jgi:hypothetical protein
MVPALQGRYGPGSIASACIAISSAKPRLVGVETLVAAIADRSAWRVGTRAVARRDHRRRLSGLCRQIDELLDERASREN